MFRRFIFISCLLLVVSLHLTSSAKELLESRNSSAPDSLLLLNRFNDALSVKTIVRSYPNDPDPLKNVLAGVPDTSIVSVLMHTAWLSDRLKGEGEIADSRPSSPGTQYTGHDMQYRLMRFGLIGSQHAFKYGGTYRIAGERFASLQDQATREVWGEWNKGMIRLKTTLTEWWNNVDKDSSRPRMAGIKGQTTLAVAPTTWPELMISYVRDSSWTSLEPSGVFPQRNLSDVVEAALSYAKPTWNAKLLSAYSLNSDLLRVGGETVGFTHAISGLYRATDRVTIAPTLSLRADEQRWSGIHLKTPSASLALSYAPHTDFNLSAFGSYATTQSSDGLLDSSTSKMTSIVTWTYFKTPKLRTIFSVDASYTTMLDNVQPARSTEDLSGLLKVQLAGL